VHFGLANFPVAYCGLKIITSLSLRFPDFQRRLEASSEKANSELLEKSEAEEKAKQLDMQVHKLQVSLDASVKAADELKAEIKQLRQANEEKTLDLGKMAAILEQN